MNLSQLVSILAPDDDAMTEVLTNHCRIFFNESTGYMSVAVDCLYSFYIMNRAETIGVRSA